MNEEMSACKLRKVLLIHVAGVMEIYAESNIRQQGK